MNICGKIRKPLLSGRTCFKPVSDEFFTNWSLSVLFKKNILLGNETKAIERAKELDELSIKNVAALVTALPVLYTYAPMCTVQLFTYTLHLYTCTVHLCTNCTSIYYILTDILLYWILHYDTDRYDDVSVPLGCRVWPPCSAASFHCTRGNTRLQWSPCTAAFLHCTRDGNTRLQWLPCSAAFLHFTLDGNTRLQWSPCSAALLHCTRDGITRLQWSPCSADFLHCTRDGNIRLQWSPCSVDFLHWRNTRRIKTIFSFWTKFYFIYSSPPILL